MKHLLVVIALFLLPGIAAAQSEDAKLVALLDEEWEWLLREFPTLATDIGDRRYDDRMIDLSLEALERRKAHARELVGKVKAIDRAKLSADNRLNYDLFLREAEEDVASQQFPSEVIQITQRGGIYSQFAGLAQRVPKATAADYEHFVRRLEEAPRLVDQSIVLLRKGMAAGITPPRITLRDAGELIANQIKD